MVIKLGSNFLMAGDEHKKMCKFLEKISPWEFSKDLSLGAFDLYYDYNPNWGSSYGSTLTRSKPEQKLILSGSVSKDGTYKASSPIKPNAYVEINSQRGTYVFCANFMYSDGRYEYINDDFYDLASLILVPLSEMRAFDKPFAKDAKRIPTADKVINKMKGNNINLARILYT